MLHLTVTASTSRALLNTMMSSMRIVTHCNAAHAELTRPSLGSLDIMASKKMFVGFAWSEHVCGFAVDHVVTCEELLLGHAERDSADVLDEAHYEGGPDYVPADDKEGAYDSVRY